MPVSNTYDLSAWYAHPLEIDDAKNKYNALQLLRKRDSASSYRIEEIILRYWMARDIEGDVKHYSASCQNEVQQALVTMIYGQLLMSQKRLGAMDYLNEGFRLASSLFQGAAYLDVLRRHEQLGFIVLSPRPAKALLLEDLLREAAIVKKLRGKPDHHRDIRADNTDTLG